MPKTLAFKILLSVTLLAHTAQALAQQPAEAQGGPAWQVTLYDITVTPDAAARSFAARAVITARNVGTGPGRTLTVRLSPSAKVESASAGGTAARITPGVDSLTKLQTARLQLPAEVAPGVAVTVEVEYRMPVAENTGLAAVSPEGLQLLPLSNWYPTPNTPVSPRGTDYAPVRLKVNGVSSAQQVRVTAVSSGGQKADGFSPGEAERLVSTGVAAQGGGYEQTLNSQPFFLTGKWQEIGGSGDARGVTAWMPASFGADERKEAEALVNLASSARAFYATLLGPAPDSPVRIVGVRRGAGFDSAGTILLDSAVFRRQKIDSVTAVRVAEAVARLWVGGASGVEGEGAGVIREGLARYLAMLFVEKQFGKPAADAEWTRVALLYAPVAERDAPLSKLTPGFDTYFNSATNKGALAWRIVAAALGRDSFASVLRGQMTGAKPLSLAALRARIGEAGGDRASLLMRSLFDMQTDTDLMVGLPVARAGAWVSNLRNTGSFDVEVSVQALTETGERLNVTARVPAKDFGEAQFRTASKIVRVEVDPEKLYPQTNYANDVVPAGPAAAEAIEQARAALTQQPARAEELARGVLARSPANEEARVVLARALVEQNRLDDAEREFRAALDSPLPTPATLAWSDIGLGEIAMRRNRPADAARLFDAAARANAEYSSTFAARAARMRAEAAAGSPPAPDEQIKSAVSALDAAIRTGHKADIEALLVPGELQSFSRGIVGTQPEIWQTRLLRTETLGPDLMAADVTLTARTLGRDQSGPAVYVFLRTPSGWKLAEVPIFEVK
ncbi:MAG TPA: tetratricopeptide repeat protein [Pyrinomonadaceae bacterium]|jgi:tetratricopeptide (TPR) repeat protein|nr:tetratricopeptide repeat protein [Pyrinomonadaceae bacterium]